MDDKLKRAIDRRMVGAALSAASKARILQAAAQRKGRRTMKAKRTAIIAATAAVLLITGCVGVALYRDSIRQTVGDWEEEHTGTPLSLSQSDAGYTITLDEIFGSSRTVYIKGTVSRDDGKPLRAKQDTGPYAEPARTVLDLRWNTLAELKANGDNGRGGSEGPFVLPDTDLNDNKAEFIISQYYEKWPEEYTFIFDMIFYKDTDTDKYTMVEGNWTFTVPAKWEPVDEILPLDREVTLADGTVLRLDTLYFDPLDIRLEGAVVQESPESSSDRYARLQLKNGEILMEHIRGGSENFHIQFESFNRGMGHIGIDDVQALVIGDTTVPLSE